MDLDKKRTIGLKHEPEKVHVHDKEETLQTISSYVDEQFNFPFKPYDIQIDLMKAAYESYEKSKFALLESPTGTGKSLSLICSSLTWLRNHQSTEKKNLEEKKETLAERIETLREEEEASGDWLNVQTKRQEANRQLVELNKRLERLQKFEHRSEARRHAKLHGQPFESYAALNPILQNISHEDDMIKKRNNIENEDSSSNQIIGSQGSKKGIDDDEEDVEKKIKDYQNDEEHFIRPKIYYASRTHSQLGQFINEIKRTKFANNVQAGTHSIRLTPLGSRSNLCVNPEVLKLKDSNAINERCTELQREKKADKRCPYMKGKQVNALKEDILSSVQDIEDIVIRGRILGACPYYATRMAVPEAEVVILPYNNLLHHDTRKASSLDLRESVVILDEAHNILETICSIHSAKISGQQLIGSHAILSRYYQKFYTRMNPKNAEVIKNIVQCLTALIRFLNSPAAHIEEFDTPKSVSLNDSLSSEHEKQKQITKKTNHTTQWEEFMIDVVKLIGAAKIERFNIYKIIDYFNRSQLARKLIGLHRQENVLDLSLELYDLNAKKETASNGDLSTLVEEQVSPDSTTNSASSKRRKLNNKKIICDAKESAERKRGETKLEFLKANNPEMRVKHNNTLLLSSYPIYVLVDFFKSLTNLANDGKVLVNHCNNDIQQSLLKFILLNPSSQFKQMTQEARSIILAGGTMQPFNEFIELLFGPLKISREKLTQFSCGHVVGPERLFVATLSGSAGKPLELSYKTRSCSEILDEFGKSVMNIASVAPGGMVCFLPSYDYEQLCFKRWNQIGVIQRIETKWKQVFREPRQASNVKAVLEDYARVIEKGKSSKRGALLLCVVGGKMSEGINFNDDLGRCVVMIGLPYANIKSSELQQKMSYYDRTCKLSFNGQQPGTISGAGQHYYENLCVKGINQSIGRAVRHKDDYAAIILLDRRYYSKQSIRQGLPQWMCSSMNHFDYFGSMQGHLIQFYKSLDNKSSE